MTHLGFTPDYKIDHSALNYLTLFYGDLSAFKDSSIDPYWLSKLKQRILQEQAYAAVSIGRNLIDEPDKESNWMQAVEQLEEGDQQNYHFYLQAVEEVTKNPDQFLPLTITQLHRLITLILRGTDGLKRQESIVFRKGHGLVSKGVWQHGVKKEVQLEISVPPSEIQSQLNDLVAWFNEEHEVLNPALSAAIFHFKIAQLHPYDDGNGRLSRLVAKLIMLTYGYHEYTFLSPESYYYTNRFQYFDTLEQAIQSKDLSKWLEFYFGGLKSSAQRSFQLLAELSGGSVDLEARKVVQLTPRERIVLEELMSHQQAGAAEIAAVLKVSRQNIHMILKRLVSKGLVTARGRGTTSRYLLTFKS